MKVLLNGKDETFPDGITVAELVALKGLNPDTVIVEHNYVLVKKDTWTCIVLIENDRVEILRFVGGG